MYGCLPCVRHLTRSIVPDPITTAPDQSYPNVIWEETKARRDAHSRNTFPRVLNIVVKFQLVYIGAYVFLATTLKN